MIDKTVERLGENSDGFEVKRYRYEITKYGHQVVDTIGDTEERHKLTNFLEKIKDIGLPNTMDISIAAKAYYILQRENKPLTSGEIRKKAESFGWDIDSGSIDKAERFLSELELIHR